MENKKTDKVEKEVLPDSRDCESQITDIQGYKRCAPCAEKLCNIMFGTDLCRYHYKKRVE